MCPAGPCLVSLLKLLFFSGMLGLPVCLGHTCTSLKTQPGYHLLHWPPLHFSGRLDPAYRTPAPSHLSACHSRCIDLLHVCLPCGFFPIPLLYVHTHSEAPNSVSSTQFRAWHVMGTQSIFAHWVASWRYIEMQEADGAQNSDLENGLGFLHCSLVR